MVYNTYTGHTHSPAYWVECTGLQYGLSTRAAICLADAIPQNEGRMLLLQITKPEPAGGKSGPFCFCRTILPTYFCCCLEQSICQVPKLPWTYCSDIQETSQSSSVRNSLYDHCLMTGCAYE